MALGRPARRRRPVALTHTRALTLTQVPEWLSDVLLGGGLRRHFALASERKVVSADPIAAFVEKHVYGRETPLAPPDVIDDLFTK